MPIEYARSKLNAIPGDVAARVIIVPKIGPTPVSYTHLRAH